MVAAENAAARSSTPPAEATSPDHNPSRDEISQALGSKDPAWFRQTADRGTNSAAYRKDQSEDPDTLEALSGRTQLPGMSRSTSTEPETDAPRPRPRSHTGSRTGSPLLSAMTDAQKLGPPADIQAGQDATASGRSSPTRPPSPTKGMGGFVQSAMMKRTDSVKRWSVTTAAGLQRGNTISRNSYDNKSGSTSPAPDTTSRPVSRARDSFSRPGSSHAKDSAPSYFDVAAPEETASASPKPDISKPEVLKPEDDGEKTLPTSPSRTMDPRRWSPTKGSSWLDAALKAPESPKPKPAAVSNQPAWMVELNKAKAARANNGSVDFGRAGAAIKKHEVKTGGLVRPAPPGMTVKPPGLGSLKSPPLGIEKPLTPGLRSAGLNKSPVLERASPPPGINKPLTPGLRSGSLEKQSPVVDKPSPGIEEPERRVSVVSPPLGKDTPPNNEFRTSLRSRGKTLGQADKAEPISRSRGATVGQADKGGEPVNELANVFGKLRKATTQNYVAPDELKNNITRGKAGLNITGGPRPYEKKDEFKDAILKKKDEFKQAKQEGRAVVPNAKPLQEQPLPEGLARRATISRAKSISHSRDSSAVKSPSTESPVQTLDMSHSRATSTAKSPSAVSSAKASGSSHSTDTYTVESHSTESSSKALGSSQTAESHLPSPRKEISEEKIAPKVERPEPTAFQPSPPKEKSVPGRLPNKLGGALADRFNPALAGLLARGPPGMGGAAAKSPGTSSGTGVSDAGNEPGQGPQLTHMTKNRVRGPRKRTPASATASKAPAPASSAATEPESATTSSSLPDADAATLEQVEERSASPPSSEPAEPAVAEQPKEDPKEEFKEEPKSDLVISRKSSVTSPVESPIEQFSGTMAEDKPRSSGVISLVDSSKRRLAEQKTVSTGSRIALVDSSKSNVAPGSPKKIHEQVAALAARTQPVVEEKKVDEPPPRSPSPRKLDVRRMSKFLDETSQSPPKHEPEPSRTPSPLKRGFGGPPSPPKPSDNEKVDSQPTVSVKNGAAMFGRPLTPAKTQTQEERPVEKRVEKPLPTPLDLRPSTPAKALPERPLPVAPTDEALPSPIPSPTRSPSKSGSEVSAMLKDFFGKERPKRDYRVDAAEILMNRPQAGALVQTQKAQLFQITEQGKRVPVPAHYERVLFEREMYICSHTFSNAARKKVQEVYFWAGDEVAPSVLEDAQVFVGREAKSLGGTLIKIRQGKETAEFIQALGGIVIVRRGSSNKYDSLASNMLCGRNYLGQIVFDEVDFAPLTLCSGFPYIITQSGKCYLWKGKGAGVDELSCARLIGMDSALMGELVEVEEGKEPEEFWGLFDGKKKMSSADHWRLKPSYDKYCGRLFCSDAADRRQVCSVPPPSSSPSFTTKRQGC